MRDLSHRGEGKTNTSRLNNQTRGKLHWPTDPGRLRTRTRGMTKTRKERTRRIVKWIIR